MKLLSKVATFFNRYKKEFLLWTQVITILFIAVSFVWSIHTYKQLLPLHKSNVVFSESDINISESPCGEDKNKMCDFIETVINNIGEAEAEDVRFVIYSVPFSEKKELGDGIKQFDDKVVHFLQPKTKTTFGTFWLENKEDNKELTLEERQIALLFHLEYTDSISFKHQDKFFFFQYNLGIPKVHSLIGADFNKIYEKLLRNINDNDLREFIKDNSPNKMSLIQLFLKQLGVGIEKTRYAVNCLSRLSCN